MHLHSLLPPLPFFDIEVEKELPSSDTGFLRHISRLCRIRKSDGKLSRSFVYDEVDRSALDAVVVIAHFLGNEAPFLGKRLIVLRSALRPPIFLRKAHGEPLCRGLWELPAGLVENEESGASGLLRAAARELFEEAGFAVAPDELAPLGHPSYPSPGVLAERHFYFHVEVDPLTQVRPTLDGSPLEEAGEVIALPLGVALKAAEDGLLGDAKTELALRRFANQQKGGHE